MKEEDARTNSLKGMEFVWEVKRISDSEIMGLGEVNE